MKTSPKRLTLEQKIVVGLQSFWSDAFKTVHTTPADPTRFEDLHPSSLPYCGVKHAYELNLEGIPTEREMELSGVFYTGVGHVVHHLLQNWLGRMEVDDDVKHEVKVYGNWQCLTPGCKGFRGLCEYKTCPKCKGQMEYAEIGIRWRNVIGHIDKIIKIGKYVLILDYKTTGPKALNRHKYDGGNYLPYKKNKAQVRCYCPLFRRQYREAFKKGGVFEGCKVKGWVLAYVSRDHPSYQYAFCFGEMKKADMAIAYKQVKKDSRHFAIAKKATTLEDFGVLVKQKPCGSYKEYQEIMEDPYNACPLAKVCFSPNKLESKLTLAISARKKRERKSK